MKNIKFAILSSLVILTLSVSGVLAKNNFDKNKSLSLVQENLTKRLKTELASDKLSVKFTTVKQKAVSNNQIVLNGDAKVIVADDNTALPIHFDATVNPLKDTVEVVEYVFVEDTSSPSNVEESLMKNLLKQIGADYKTESVVISLDGYEIENKSSNQKTYKGIGEVKIDENNWEKIEFEVEMNGQSSATKIKYKVK